MRLATMVKEFFHDRGIHSTTIQPEFLSPVEAGPIAAKGGNCAVPCQAACAPEVLCCAPPIKTTVPPSFHPPLSPRTGWVQAKKTMSSCESESSDSPSQPPSQSQPA